MGSNLTRYCLRKFAPGFGCIKFLRIPGSVSKCRPHPLRVKKRPPSCVNLGVFKRTRKPGGFRGSSRTRKTSGTPMSLRVEEFYLNLERHETPGSFIIHSIMDAGRPATFHEPRPFFSHLIINRQHVRSARLVTGSQNRRGRTRRCASSCSP